MSQVQAVAVQGVQLQISPVESPDVFQTIVNVSKFAQSGSTKVVDVSNVTNLWMSRFPTLLDVGQVQMDVFWVPEDPTLNSSATGLRGLWQGKTLCQAKFIYNDGNNATDTFQCYVTKYGITGTQADVLKASIELSGTGQPSLV